MIGNLLGGIWKWAAAAASVGVVVLYGLLKIVRAQRAAEKAKRVRYQVKAAGEKAARKHMQKTQETTREVDENIRSKSDADVTDELRQYARDADRDR